jgi:hypothetical protein
MLESPTLLLRLAAGNSRAIADPASGAQVGFASRLQDAERGWWARLFGPILCVHEQDESPLVFTVRRSWWWWGRVVHDAEGERVGCVTRRCVRDRNHLVVAVTRRTGRGVVYERPAGNALAETVDTPEGTVLTFTKAIEGDPFCKMLLLAAALLAGPEV